jgi:hypothetical protein
MAADTAGHRSKSPDGWTREFELVTAVGEPDFWTTQSSSLAQAFAFLTTDMWSVRFIGGGALPPKIKKPAQPKEDCVALLSGGLDSLVGAIDLCASGLQPFAVSQVSRGDSAKQEAFAGSLGGGLRHLQLNHNTSVPNPEEPPSQRARSLIFIAWGVLIATSLKGYADGDTVDLYLCENGFIALNPPLTGGRLGSLSTRTAHPVFLAGVQSVLDAAGLRVRITNPYQHKTKGEMLRECQDQGLLKKHAHVSTSCGRYMRFNYRHCGRCVPCQIRRAAFLRWREKDRTTYVYEDLGKKDADHAGFDDVRSVAMAIAESQGVGLDTWIGSALAFDGLKQPDQLREVIGRGLKELAALHKKYGVR